jgi:hypothetical protein
MDVVFMIVLVGAAVLFLSNVFRQAKNERERALQRSANRPRRPESNTERFLEEVNRRRQQAQARSPGQPPARPVSQAPMITPLPRRELTPRKPPLRTEKPRIERSTPRSPVATKAAKLMEVIPAEKPGKLQVASASSAPPPPLDPAALPSSTPGQFALRPQPVMLQQLIPLLRSRQTLGAAFMLHEILGSPRCRRR